MHAEQRARAHDRLRAQGIQRALFASPATVTWLTGFALPVQSGPSPFTGGPPLVWYEDGQFTLIVMSGLDSDAIPVINYEGYTVDTPLAGTDHLKVIVRDLLAKSRAGKLGIEATHLPAFLAPNDAVAIDGLLDPLRIVKSDEEIEILRRCFALTDLAHVAARAATQPGQREIDVWAAIKSTVEQAAGARVPMGNDCVANTRENNIGGWPGEVELREGDSLMVDLGVRLDGYWSDSCAVCYAGEPNERQKTIHKMAMQANEFAISLVKPGVLASEIDRRVRQFIRDAGYPVYPHHTGHGIGVLAHEEPRIVPYNDSALEAGMVIMLEPGIYFPKEVAARLEDALLVTSTGAEVLTQHEKGLP